MNTQKILVPLDFSDIAHNIVDYVNNIAPCFQAAVTFYHVIDERNFVSFNPVYVFPEYYPEIKPDADAQERLITSSRQELEKFIKQKNITGYNYDIKLDVGIPYSKICEYAEEKAYDLIVVGSHGRTSIKNIFLGSVVDYIAHHAKAPVLIYKKK